VLYKSNKQVGPGNSAFDLCREMNILALGQNTSYPGTGFFSFPHPHQGDARMVSSLYSFEVYLVVLSVFQTV
jgi:hypothetical protein